MHESYNKCFECNAMYLGKGSTVDIFTSTVYKLLTVLTLDLVPMCSCDDKLFCSSVKGNSWWEVNPFNLSCNNLLYSVKLQLYKLAIFLFNHFRTVIDLVSLITKPQNFVDFKKLWYIIVLMSFWKIQHTEIISY